MRKLDTTIKSGKIYKITSPNTSKVYIGSTGTTLRRRLTMHNIHYRAHTGSGSQKFNTCFDVLVAGDSEIELIAEYKNILCKDLFAKEGEILRETENVVNKKIEGRTKKQYYLDNREKLLAKANERNRLKREQKLKMA